MSIEVEETYCEMCETSKQIHKNGLCYECWAEETEYNCDYCEDTGKVEVMEYVWKGDPHMAPTGMRVCPHCCPNDDDAELDQDR